MKVKLPLAKARPLAEQIKTALEPACERIEIAGSIRRQCPTVGDIEMVAIPRLIPDLEAQLSLFSDPPQMVSALDLLLEKLLEEKDNFRRGDKNGPLFKNFIISGHRHSPTDIDDIDVGLDLFLTTPQQWGYILALRTGPGEFNRAWVTPKNKGGLLPNSYRFSGGWLYGPDGERIETPEEYDIFALIGDGRYLPPESRDNWRDYYETG